MGQLPEKEEGGCEVLCFCFFPGQSHLPGGTSFPGHWEAWGCPCGFTLSRAPILPALARGQNMSSARKGEGDSRVASKNVSPVTASIAWRIDICVRGNTPAPKLVA